MIKKEDLVKLEKLKNERNYLIEKINRMESKPRRMIIDGVRGSSKQYPYISHTYRIEGLDYSLEYRKRKKTVKKFRKLLSLKEQKIEKEILHIEYELNYVEDSAIRELIRLRYEEGLNWIQIMHKMRIQ